MKILIAIAGIVLIFAGLTSAKDMRTYKATYEKSMEKFILSHGMRMTDLGQQYTKSLDALLTKVKKAGDLDKTTAVMEEIARFRKEKGMPKKPSALLDIKNIQSTFTKQALTHDVNKAKRIISLASKYDNVLERLQRTLVSSDKLNDAKAVQAERRKVEESEDVKSAKALIEQPQLTANKKSIASVGNQKKAKETTVLKTLSNSRKEWLLLADIDPVEAKVGYSHLTRYGKDSDGLGIGDKTFETALLAHASSALIYSLDEKYTKLSTSYGMKNGSGGSAIFYILVDGKEKFKSVGMWSYGNTKAKGHKPVFISISGAKKLELITVGVRGGAGAWSAWGDPKIK